MFCRSRSSGRSSTSSTPPARWCPHLGPRELPSKTWTRPKVTQHTAVAEQSAEKAELTSQKMIIGEVTGTAQTFGGYVNVSRQLIDWATGGSIMDLIISDLAQQYALQTENDATDTFLAAATAASTNLATGANTEAQVTAAFWGAVGQVYAGTKGAGRVIAAASPQMLGLLGPLFAPINPQDSQSTGFQAVNYGQGAAGAISRCPDLHHQRPGRQQGAGAVHRRRRGVRNPHRRPPGRRAVACWVCRSPTPATSPRW